MASPSMVPLSSPPPPPDVVAQQNPGMVSQFVQGYQPGMEAAPSAPRDLIRQRMMGIAEGLRDVARVIATTDPSLMPILKRMVEAGSMLMNSLDQSEQETRSGSASVQRVPPEPVGPTGLAEGAQPGLG